MASRSRPRLLVLLGSPRPRGTTSRLASAFVGETRAWRVIRRRVFALRIQPCRACAACEGGRPCPIRDDFDTLASDLDRADALLLAAPMYFYGFPSPLKAVIDRCQVYWRNPDLPARRNRPAFMLGACGSCPREDFNVLLKQGRAFFNTVGFSLSDSLIVPALERPGGGRRFRLALQNARRLGARLNAQA